jgi:hypothetical protein
VCGDDLRALLASASAWRAMARFMLSGKLAVLQLDDRDLDAPVRGLDIEDLADVLVDRVGSDSASSSVRRPTTARSVVSAIWLIAAETPSMATTERTTSATRLERTEKAGKGRWAVSIHIGPAGSATASAVLQAFRARTGPGLEPENHDALRLGSS